MACLIKEDIPSLLEIFPMVLNSPSFWLRFIFHNNLFFIILTFNYCLHGMTVISKEQVLQPRKRLMLLSITSPSPRQTLYFRFYGIIQHGMPTLRPTPGGLFKNCGHYSINITIVSTYFGPGTNHQNFWPIKHSPWSLAQDLPVFGQFETGIGSQMWRLWICLDKPIALQSLSRWS